MKNLYKEFMTTPLAGLKLSKEEMFHAGCGALKDELIKFIDDKLTHDETALGQFGLGQNDGLRWIKDHLIHIFENND